MSRPVGELRNLGPVTAGWLNEIGIRTEADLRAAGPVEAWRRMKFLHDRAVTLNALYAMQAALLGCDWRELPQEIKDELRREAARPEAGRN